MKMILFLLFSLPAILTFSCGSPPDDGSRGTYRYHYTDDFEDEPAGRRPSHWTSPMGQSPWTVAKERKNHYLVSGKPAAPSSGHAASVSGHVASASGHVASVSGHAASASGHVASFSEHAASVSGHAASASGHVASFSEHAASVSGHAASFSEHIPPAPSRVWLHLFDRNPSFAGRFRLEDAGFQSAMAILVRFNAVGSWIRLEYNAGLHQFRLIEQEDIGRDPKVLDHADWLAGKNWHDFHVAADSLSLRFSVDGQTVLSTDQLRHCTFGRLGLETTNCRLALDDIVYHGNQGRPNDGVIEGEIRVPLDSTKMNSAGRPFWGLHLGVLEQQGTDLMGIVGFRDHETRDITGPYPYAIIRSQDQGMTWEGLGLNERNWLYSEEGIAIRGICPNLTAVEGGHILMGYDKNTGRNAAFFSPDRGETWTKRGEIIVTDELKQIHVGHPWHLFMMTMPGKLSSNSWGLYYPTTRVLWNSTDQGRTWKPVYVFHAYDQTSYSPRSQEHQVIELPDRKLAVYSRDDGARENKPESMTIVRRISTDGGHSWSEYSIDNTPFFASKCAFSIKEDPYRKGTVWMFWTYNNKNDEPTVNNQPRTRMGLAVSRDYTETWEYVMDVDDWGFPSYDTSTFDFNHSARGKEAVEQASAYLQRDNRYTNLSLWVGPEHLYMNARRRFRHGKPKLEEFCIFYTRVEKSKIRTYPAFPGTRY